MKLLLLFSLAAFAASQSLEDRVEATFKLCCLRNGVPADVASAMCTYKMRKYYGTSRSPTYGCYFAKNFEYASTITYCSTDGEDDRDCVKAKGLTEVEEACVDLFNRGKPVDMVPIMENEEKYRPCIRGDLWYKATMCAFDTILAKGGHRQVFQQSFNQPIANVCGLSKESRLNRKIFLKLCTKSLGINFHSDEDEAKEASCKN